MVPRKCGAKTGRLMKAELRDRLARKATLGEWLGVAWLGVGDAMNAFFFFKAYQRTSVAIASAA